MKITQKIFFIFVLMIFLVINSWAFTFTTNLDFAESYENVEQYAFPSVIANSELKDNIHIALIYVYDYVSTGNTDSKNAYQEHLNKAIQSEYDLFRLSQSQNDFEFTKNFNEKLLEIYYKADELVAVYEKNPTSPSVNTKIQELNVLRDSFNSFLEQEITNQITNQIQATNKKIESTANQIRMYLYGVSIIVVIIIIFLLFFISNNITKPVSQLTEAAREFGKGNFKKVEIRKQDELGLFANTFNKMAEDIQASQIALEEELEKTKFLSIAAHQLRTPMAGIRWVAKMLYDGDMGKLNEEQTHHLGTALENINRMVNLINDLLDVTKIEEQRFKYDFAKHDLTKIVKDTLERFQNRIEEKNLSVVTKFEPEDEILAEVDEEKAELIFINLLDNAVKYSIEGGSIEVGMSTTAKYINCYVKDSGLGIPEESHDRVFSKFFRGQNVMKVVTDGSGLGLFLVKDIITKHNGSISFESKENEGTTFKIKLPIKQPNNKN